MKTLKIKFGLFSLLAVLAVSVFLTSCEQESFAPQQMDDVNLPPATEYLNSTPSLTSMPDINSVPEMTAENTAEGSIDERGGCVVANAWNYYPPLGYFYAYSDFYDYSNGAGAWVFSDKYYDSFIYLYNVVDICDLYDVYFHTYDPFCGNIGTMYVNTDYPNTLYNLKPDNTWKILTHCPD